MAKNDLRAPLDSGDIRPAPALDCESGWDLGDRASYLVAARELSRFQLGPVRVDIREWPVFASDGRLVGAVNRLMVETATKKVRYISVSLIPEAAHDYRPTAPGSVLVPIGVVRRLDDRQAVLLEGLASAQLARAPRLRARAVMRADEVATLAAYGMPNSHRVPDADFYNSPSFDERRLSVAG